jgi:hypothetical protein
LWPAKIRNEPFCEDRVQIIKAGKWEQALECADLSALFREFSYWEFSYFEDFLADEEKRR